jgi:hypothetical protein
VLGGETVVVGLWISSIIICLNLREFKQMIVRDYS